jgi:hypothetical protein
MLILRDVDFLDDAGDVLTGDFAGMRKLNRVGADTFQNLHVNPARPSMLAAK